MAPKATGIAISEFPKSNPQRKMQSPFFMLNEFHGCIVVTHESIFLELIDRSRIKL